MDEPLGTLDADLRLAMCEFLRARQLEERVTTVYVTHDQEEALRLADRIVVMSQGEILQAAPAAEVYDRPADLFVARFAGSPGMNFLAGEARGARVRCGAHEFAVGKELPEGKVTLGIRPEAVALDGGSALRGRVAVDEYLGSSRCLHIDTPLGRIVARVAPEAHGARGDEVGLTLDPAHLLAFDGASGRLLA
jgi:multiple sugar transport system ATP-binding protein